MVKSFAIIVIGLVTTIGIVDCLIIDSKIFLDKITLTFVTIINLGMMGFIGHAIVILLDHTNRIRILASLIRHLTPGGIIHALQGAILILVDL
jgi:hypothetical protein